RPINKFTRSPMIITPCCTDIAQSPKRPFPFHIYLFRGPKAGRLPSSFSSLCLFGCSFCLLVLLARSNTEKPRLVVVLSSKNSLLLIRNFVCLTPPAVLMTTKRENGMGIGSWGYAQFY